MAGNFAGSSRVYGIFANEDIGHIFDAFVRHGAPRQAALVYVGLGDIVPRRFRHWKWFSGEGESYEF